METFTIALVALVDDALLAPPRATRPTLGALYDALGYLPVHVVYAPQPGPQDAPAFYVYVVNVEHPGAHAALVGVASRRLEDAGYDIAHRAWTGRRTFIAVFDPAAA